MCTLHQYVGHLNGHVHHTRVENLAKDRQQRDQMSRRMRQEMSDDRAKQMSATGMDKVPLHKRLCEVDALINILSIVVLLPP